MKYEKLAFAVRVLQNTQNLVSSRCFAEDGEEIYRLRTHVQSNVLLIKSFVWLICYYLHDYRPRLHSVLLGLAHTSDGIGSGVGIGVGSGIGVGIGSARSVTI